ncbi:hypothetical protein BV25DRAFT_1828231 [Artomyces pyxidatus]|uniref:Uncharacterized protein n=1 Tax=Artomyces pyxidatus TaxID=48021 RepID=A0ACB8SWB7_9AGAM|nr:hypothetical protein BV25DRAFT_1828231 [Artomyces pyxidatus]
MTIESCIAFCSAAFYLYAGVEFGTECFCDYAIQNPGTLTNLSECHLPCSGNSSEVCGAANRMDLFFSGDPNDDAPIVISPITLGFADSWVTLGCFTDDVNDRTLSHLAPSMYLEESTAEETICIAYCESQSFNFAGLEFGTQCCERNLSFILPALTALCRLGCGNDLGNGTQAPLSDCHLVCQDGIFTGSEFCGGRERLTVYQKDICISSSVSNFWLIAFYDTPPSPSPIGFYLVLSEVDEAGYTILTYVVRRTPARLVVASGSNWSSKMGLSPRQEALSTEVYSSTKGSRLLSSKISPTRHQSTAPRKPLRSPSRLLF